MMTNLHLHKLEFLTLLKRMMQISKSLLDFFFSLLQLSTILFTQSESSVYILPQWLKSVQAWQIGCLSEGQAHAVQIQNVTESITHSIWEISESMNRITSGGCLWVSPHQYRSLHSVLCSQSEVIWPQHLSSLLDQIFFTHRNLVFYNFVRQFFWRKVSVTWKTFTRLWKYAHWLVLFWAVTYIDGNHCTEKSTLVRQLISVYCRYWRKSNCDRIILSINMLLNFFKFIYFACCKYVDTEWMSNNFTASISVFAVQDPFTATTATFPIQWFICGSPPPTLTATYWFCFFSLLLFQMGKIFFHCRPESRALIPSAPPCPTLSASLPQAHLQWTCLS